MLDLDFPATTSHFLQPSPLRSQLLTIIKIAIPAMMTFVFGTLSELINTYFIGRYLNDARILAGAGMGNIIISMMCLSVFMGMNGALETLISQSKGAASVTPKGGSTGETLCPRVQHDLAVGYLNRGRLIILLAFVPIICVLLNIDTLLINLGQDAQTSVYARNYVVAQIPGLIIQAQFDCVMRYLSAHEKSHIPMCTQMISTALHIGWCYLFIVKWEQGILGASIAICITYTTNFLALVFYTTVVDKRERKIWTFSRFALKGWVSYLKLGIPGTLMIMMDMWCYEIITLQSGYLIIEATAAQIVLNNLEVLFNQIPLGIGIAASTLIGGAIGESDVLKAKRYLRLILAFAFGVLLTLQLALHLNRYYVAKFFSEDPQVQAYILSALNWASHCIFMDGLVTLMIGIIKGIGKQAQATFAYVVCFYFISVPASYFFCFTQGLGLKGLWIGLACGLFTLVISLALLIFKANFTQISTTAREKYIRETTLALTITTSLLKNSDWVKRSSYDSERYGSTSSSSDQSSGKESGNNRPSIRSHFDIESQVIRTRPTSRRLL